jgi:succinoglycan biosynthesis transport protein ExoP
MENQLPAHTDGPSSKSFQPLNYSDYGYSYDDGFRHIPLYDYWYILVKRKWLIFMVFCSIVLSVALIVYLKTPTYLATTTLQIIQDNTSAMIGERDPFPILGGDAQARFYETQYMLLNSRPMAQRIIKSLNLKEHPEFNHIIKDMEEDNKTPEEIENALTNEFLNQLRINPLKRSHLVEISYESSDKHLAKNVANAVYSDYVTFCMHTRQQSYSLIKGWLQDELVKLANKVETSEKELYQYGKQKKFLPLEGENNVTVKKYVELSNLLTMAQAERSKREAQYRQINKNQGETSLMTTNPLIVEIREEMIKQKAKVASLSQIYKNGFPELQVEKAKLQELQSRLNTEIKRIRDSIAADYQAAVKSENLLREELETQKTNVEQFQDNMVQHRILKRDMESNEQLYQALLSRMKETSIASTMVASNVAVITPAELPLVPYKPKKLLNILLASVIGLISGVGLAFFMEYLDRSIKTNEELEKVCRIPSLGVIPQLSSNGKVNLPYIHIPLLPGKKERSEAKMEIKLMTFEQPKSAISEAVYHIRTSLELSASRGASKSILITSPNPDDGKTTISINLASALAASGRKVLLLDADLRKPNVHTLFQQDQSPGLSNFLTGSASREEIIRESFIPNLYLIPAGDAPPNPVALLTSLDFEEFLRDLQEDFQHIIIDSPPIIGFTDGRIISTMADGTLLVIKHHITTREAGRLAVQLLSQVNCKILGGVLNMAHKNRLGYYGYGEFYKYYSKMYKQYS